NLIDIFTSNASPLVASFVVNEFLISKGMPENEAYALYGVGMSLLPLFMLLSLGIKYIADRYGRKIALTINMLGMSISAIFVIFSHDFASYLLGALIGNAFIAADIQMLLVNEEAPKEKRSQYFMLIKIIGLIGALMVPFMRGIFITSANPNWRAVFFLPFIGGLIVSLLIIFTLKESSVYLTMKERKKSEESTPQEQHDKESFIHSMKRIPKLKNFKMVILILFVGLLGSMGGSSFRSYWEPFLASNFTLEEVNLIYYIRYLISIPWGYFIGFLNDKKGRKVGLLTNLTILPLFLIICLICIRNDLIFLTGLTYGIFIFALWLIPDTAGIMSNELIPTQYRASIAIFTTLLGLFIFIGISVFFSMLRLWLDFESLFLVIVIPGCLVAIPLTIKFLPETKGTDLTTITE
ncbi:MAG: MFS transporter, partial [Promethearchaeota archaeon]